MKQNLSTKVKSMNQENLVYPEFNVYKQTKMCVCVWEGEIKQYSSGIE